VELRIDATSVLTTFILLGLLFGNGGVYMGLVLVEAIESGRRSSAQLHLLQFVQ
jgi:hypothetical protein